MALLRPLFAHKAKLYSLHPDYALYHIQVLDASVEVVHAVILAEGYGGRSQEVETVANPGCMKIVRVSLLPPTPLF